jgi:hypothetical protein
MTHDELLTKIDNVFYEDEGGMQLDLAGFNNQYRAIRSVVELHKPFMYDGRMGQYERCSFCTTEEEWLGEIYPCHTIQTIEKELG